MKYIIEFEDEPCMRELGMNFYKCIQAPSRRLSDRFIKRLTPYEPDIAPGTNVGNITNSCAHENDQISRQAAIDVIEAGRLTKLIDAETAVNGLKALPSAQPDLSEYSDKLWKNAYERGKAEAEADKDELLKILKMAKFEYEEAWRIITHPTPDVTYADKNRAQVILDTFRDSLGKM